MKHLIAVVAGLVSSAIALQVQGQVLLYDNFDNSLSPTAYPSLGNNHEFGDQVTLATGTPRTINTFSFQLFTENLSGNEQVEVRFYHEDGDPTPQGPLQPQSVIFDSGLLPVTQSGQSIFSIENLSLTVPDTFVWTVQFTGVTSGETAGVVIHHPPAVGTSHNDFWERNNSSWQLSQLQNSSHQPIDSSFGAQIAVVPEPAEFAAVSGIALLGFILLRRFRILPGALGS